MSFFSKVLDSAISTDSKAVKTSQEVETPAEGMGEYVKALPENAFRHLLCQERKRSDRSRKSFLLMLVKHKISNMKDRKPALERVLRPLAAMIRETDTLGWFESANSLGVIFSELGDAELSAAVVN